MEWKTYRISEIASIKSGKRLPAGHDFCLEPTAYPYIRARDIKDGRINRDNLAYISQETQSKIKKYIVNNADIVITIVGVSIGDTAFVTTDFEGMNLTENAVRLTNFSEKVNSEYLAYYLGQSFMKHYMEVLASGAAQAKLGIYKIEKIKCTLPPLPTQQRIATILSSHDNLIEINNRRIKLLEQMAEMIYKEWFVRFRFPGHENCKMIDGLPEGWKIETVDSFCKVFTGKKDVNQTIVDGQYPFFSCSAQDFRSNDYIYDGKAILVAGNGNTGKSKFYDGKFDLYQRTYAVVCEDDFIYYLYWRFKTDFEKIYAGGSRGTAIPYIVLKNITKYKFVYHKETIDTFVKIAKPIFTQINILQSQNANLARQRDMLLPRLMSGKIELK